MAALTITLSATGVDGGAGYASQNFEPLFSLFRMDHRVKPGGDEKEK